MMLRFGVATFLGLFLLMSALPAQEKADDALAKALKEADLVFTGKIEKVNPLGRTNSIPPSIFGDIVFIETKALRGPALEAGTFKYSFRKGMKNMDLAEKGQVVVAVKQKSVTVIVAATEENLVLAKKVGGDTGFADLFNGKDLKGWKIYLSEQKADPAKTVVVKDGEIQVSGEPFGYFYTEKSYKNYIIRYSWMYPRDQPDKTTMNSGLLLHIQEPHQVWPKSIEPQGRYKDHGKIFFPGWTKEDKGAKESTFDEPAQKKALKESYEWNTTEATVKNDGSISVRINGVPVSTAKTVLTSGLIGFQSEGARIHFKDIKMKMLE
jgi:Domain of Unknown Function (DUF1080)